MIRYAASRIARFFFESGRPAASMMNTATGTQRVSLHTPRVSLRPVKGRLLAAVVICLVPLMAAADAVDTGQLVLKMHLKKDDVSKYKSVLQISFSLPGSASKSSAGGQQSLGGTAFTVNATQEAKVRTVLPGGGGEFEVTTIGENSLPGQPPILSNDTRPAIMTYDAQGKLVSVKRQTDTASSNPMFSAMLGNGLLCMQGFLLPEKPVHIGETWTNHVDIPGITSNGGSTVKTTLSRIEMYGHYRTARLHIVITTPVTATLDAALQPTTNPAEAASVMTGTAVVTNDINYALAESKVIHSVSNGITDMTVNVGKPAPVRPKKKAKGAAAPASVASNARALKMAVKTHMETNLIDVAQE